MLIFYFKYQTEMNMTKMHHSAMPGQLEVHADMRNKKSNNIVILCETNCCKYVALISLF